MSRKPIDIHIAVERRAQFCCEYCKKQLYMERGEIEHIRPRAGGGRDRIENFALACRVCNGNKSNKTHASDPVYGTMELLFNPRIDNWSEHFTKKNGLVGKTPKGRATAALLFRRTRSYFPEDLRWHWAEPISNYPNLYIEINRLRAWRLSNLFKQLEDSAVTIEPPHNIGNEQKRSFNFALDLLILETYFTRSSIQDIQKGLHLSKRTLHVLAKTPHEKMETQLIRSILLQQLATTYALQGEKNLFETLQAKAIEAQRTALSYLNRIGFAQQLRFNSLAIKINGQISAPIRRKDINQAADLAELGNLVPLIYIAEVEIATQRASRHLDYLLDLITTTLETSGYGQDTDYAKAIVLRRRWWGLLVAAHEKIDKDLFLKDIKFWKKVQMPNEIRELSFLLQRIANREKDSVDQDLLNIMRQECDVPTI